MTLMLRVLLVELLTHSINQVQAARVFHTRHWAENAKEQQFSRCIDRCHAVIRVVIVIVNPRPKGQQDKLHQEQLNHEAQPEWCQNKSST